MSNLHRSRRTVEGLRVCVGACIAAATDNTVNGCVCPSHASDVGPPSRRMYLVFAIDEVTLVG